MGRDAPVQIVTGANNLKVGDLVPAALHVAKLPGGKEIRRGKLRLSLIHILQLPAERPSLRLTVIAAVNGSSTM